MLKRMALRRYLKALLWHDGVIQSADCDDGFLWTNCKSERIDIFDSETQQIFENADAPYELGNASAAIIYKVETVGYTLTQTKVDKAETKFSIDIVVNDASGERRENIADEIEERILYRLLSYTTFTDATTGAAMLSFMRWGEVKIDTQTDTNFNGRYTLRRLNCTISHDECIKKTACGDVQICFDFGELTALDNAC